MANSILCTECSCIHKTHGLQMMYEEEGAIGNPDSKFCLQYMHHWVSRKCGNVREAL